jgi:signal transduction histidine kinase
MSIKTRLALLLGLLLLGFLAVLLLLRTMESRGLAQMASDDRRSRAQLLHHWIDLTDRVLPQFVADAAQSEEFAGLLAQAQTDTTREKIEASLASSGLSALWIVAPDGTPRFSFGANGNTGPFPLQPADFVQLVAETPGPRFFDRADGTLTEFCVRRLTARPPGAADWLVAARKWDDAQLRALAELADSQVTLGGPEETSHAATTPDTLVIVRTLPDWQGHPLQTLRLEYRAPELNRAVQADWRQTELFVAFGLLLIVAVGLALNAWVLRPLGLVGEALAHGSPVPVQGLSAQPHELGHVAQLVLSSFDQREALRQEVAERTRAQQALERSEAELRRTLDERAQLGRDLHDGVIQSLYAAGMGLAGVRAQLHPDQSEAAARLEQTRAALNETIHDVRNFIIGLEPEALKLQTFSQAVAALFEAMQNIRPFHATTHIDEAVAQRLTLAQRVHALQIAREAVSNALRHGAAGNIAVALRMTGELAEFAIVDDGGGFDAAAMQSSGFGLKNLAQRAHELGAELTVDSQPGQGTRVKISFSLHDYD